MGIEKLSTITQQLIEWDFSELYGIGFYRGHDKYAHIEIKVYPTDANVDYLHWNVIHALLPNQEIKGAQDALNPYVKFIGNYLSAIKNKRVNLVFEIARVGFSATDSWTKACGTAYIDAFVSAFDQDKFNRAKEISDLYFADETQIRNAVNSANKPW